MKKILKNLGLVCIVIAANNFSFATLNNFQMVFNFHLDLSGSGPGSSFENVCQGGKIYLKNRSYYRAGTYGNPVGPDLPIPSNASGNGLTGHYSISNNLTGQWIANIPASNWNYNQTIEFQLDPDEVFGTTQQNFSILYVGSDAIGNKSMNCSLTTHSPSQVNAGPDYTICSGNTIQLNGSGANTYLWQPTGQTTASISVNPTNTTTYSLTGTTNYGPFNTSLHPNLSCSFTDQATVYVNPKPIILGKNAPLYVCTNGPWPIINVQANGPGNFSYSWSFVEAGSNNPMILNNTTSTWNSQLSGFGTYTITVTNTVTGCSTVVTRTVALSPSATQNLNATFNHSTSVSGANFTINATPTDLGGSHTWSFHQSNINMTLGALLSSGSNPTFTSISVPQSGYYILKHTISKTPCNEQKTVSLFISYSSNLGQFSIIDLDENQITKASDQLTELDSKDGSDEAAHLLLHPNPSSGIFLLNLENKTEFTGKIEVYSYEGSLVKTIENNNHSMIDLSDLNNGNYILKFISSDWIEIERIRIHK